LTDPAIIQVLLWSLLVTVLIFVGLGAVLVVGTQWLAAFYGWGEDGSTLAAALAGIAALFGAVLLFRAIAIPVIGLFADKVVHAVEAARYPEALAVARPVPAVLSARLAVMSLLRALLVNLLALPAYLFLLFTVIGPAVLFLIVNAALLGRDLMEMVAVRHLDQPALGQWHQTGRGERWVLGLIISGLFLVPFVNMLAPILGAAMATHLFHQKKA
jgi:uncharacterized protein involved in cysteine biosynthesis